MTVDERVSRVGRFLHSKGPAEMLYGALVSSVVLAATSAGAETGELVVVATALVSVTYWLAHVYADAIGGRFERHRPRRTTGAPRAEATTRACCWAASRRSSSSSSVGCSAWTCGLRLAGPVVHVAMLAGVAAFAAHRAGVQALRCWARPRSAGAFGLLVIGLKLILTH